MKDLPYFKFFVSEWQNGDIALEEDSEKGVFIDLICYYWASECNLDRTKMMKKFRGREDSIEALIDSGIIKMQGDEVVIKFLDGQLGEHSTLREKRVEAGRRGGIAKAVKNIDEDLASATNLLEQKDSKCLADATVLLEQNPSRPLALRGEERRGDKRREDKILVDKIYDRIRASIKGHSEIERQRTTSSSSKKAIASCLKENITEDDLCRYWHNYLKVKSSGDRPELIAGFGNYVKAENVIEWLSGNNPTDSRPEILTPETIEEKLLTIPKAARETFRIQLTQDMEKQRKA